MDVDRRLSEIERRRRADPDDTDTQKKEEFYRKRIAPPKPTFKAAHDIPIGAPVCIVGDMQIGVACAEGVESGTKPIGVVSRHASEGESVPIVFNGPAIVRFDSGLFLEAGDEVYLGFSGSCTNVLPMRRGNVQCLMGYVINAFPYDGVDQLTAGVMLGSYPRWVLQFGD